VTHRMKMNENLRNYYHLNHHDYHHYQSDLLHLNNKNEIKDFYQMNVLL
jgi:hypothetical protein